MRLLPSLVILLLAAAPAAWAGSHDVAIDRLRHPMLGEREAARRALVAAMPAAREAVVAALPDAPWTVKLQLAHVLASEASSEATDALLTLFDVVDDVQADAIAMRIVRDEAASTRMLARLRAEPEILVGEGQGKTRLRALRDLLLRAEIEGKFLAHKSKTGGTGYYRGQYDGLKYARALSLEVVSRIALDDAFPVPGRYRTGHYTFLRPRPIDLWEIRDMAMNAVAELATPEDLAVLVRLDRYANTMKDKTFEYRNRIVRGGWKASEDELEDQETLTEFAGVWGDVVAALYTIERTPERAARVRAFMATLENLALAVRFPWWEESARAATAIRVGWYEEAVALYTGLLGATWGPSKSTSHYNLACAFASWSLEPGDEDARLLRAEAIYHLELSVRGGWTDIGWMQQDRDLDPIRDTDRFRKLVVYIQDELGVTRRDRDD